MTFPEPAGWGRLSSSSSALAALRFLRSTDEVSRLADLYVPLEAAFAEGLTAAEALALFAYTCPEHQASRINRELCSDQVPVEAAAFADLLDGALGKLRRFRGPVYRRLRVAEPDRFLDELCIGRTITLRGYTSASWTEAARSGGQVLFAIRARRASVIGMWASRSFSDHVLFPRGTRLAVRALARVNGGVRIDLEELDGASEAERPFEPAFIPTLVPWQAAPRN